MTRIAVAGGTGLVGRLVVAEAERRGHDVVVLSRSAGADLTSGDGVAERLAGADAVVDCVSTPSQRAPTAIDFFTATSRALLAGGADAGVRHHVTLSIVGIDDVPTGYYRGKQAQERVVRRAGRPSTILRATQFHEFAVQMVERLRLGPVVAAPRMLAAPVAAAEVAAALVDLAEGRPQDATLEMGGPERLEVADLVRAVVQADGLRCRVVPVPVPGAGPGARDGALVPTDPWRVGTQTFEQWSEARITARESGPAR